MEKLRAKWIKELAKAERRISNADFNDTKPLGLAEAYEDVLRDTDWFNEEFSKLLAEVTEFYRHAEEAHRMHSDLGQYPDADVYRDKAATFKHILDKLERLNQGKEVRT